MNKQIFSSTLKDLRKILSEAKALSLRLESIPQEEMDELQERRFYQETEAIVNPIERALTATENMLLSFRVLEASQPELFTESDPCIVVEIK